MLGQIPARSRLNSCFSRPTHLKLVIPAEAARQGRRGAQGPWHDLKASQNKENRRRSPPGSPMLLFLHYCTFILSPEVRHAFDTR
jgi:hypothetical protein